MVKSYTAKYTKIDSGYVGQLIEWPEVITEGHGIEECRLLLRDALREMVRAYQDQGKEIPAATDLFEQMSVELENDDAAVSQSRELMELLANRSKEKAKGGSSLADVKKRLGMG
jgi:predicted RNase H-like HicB family nuclease